MLVLTDNDCHPELVSGSHWDTDAKDRKTMLDYGMLKQVQHDGKSSWKMLIQISSGQHDD